MDHPALLFVLWYSMVLMTSSLNSIAYRLARSRRQWRWSHSYCEHCGATLPHHLQYLPLLNYALLRGHTRCCGARISLYHPISEAAGGTLFFLALLGALERAGRGGFA
jgi:prepilin signal peptidase PulO-like enzyme (type II secretory pathway)